MRQSTLSKYVTLHKREGERERYACDSLKEREGGGFTRKFAHRKYVTIYKKGYEWGGKGQMEQAKNGVYVIEEREVRIAGEGGESAKIKFRFAEPILQYLYLWNSVKTSDWSFPF